jgi:two-component system sensor histidine kinase KdpD
VSTLVTGRIDAFARLERDRALLLRSVSHDLRTPLGTIRAAATDLLDESEGEADRATRRHLLELIDHDAQRLDRLVSNLLSLSRIEADAMRPRRTPTDVGPLVLAAVRRAGSLDRHVEVHASVEPLPIVDLDPILFDQVLANLLDNAVRHSPAGGSVDVTATTTSGRGLQVTVADRGPGVRPEDAELIFQPFRSGAIPGSSGVGLAISRAIVNAHGGTISVHPRAGGGALFVVTIDVE